MASLQQLEYDATVFLPTGPSDLDISGNGFGWRAGVAYEMEEIALRISAIYNAPVEYDLDGDAFGGTIFTGDATANVTTPQSFELRGQTGIAPGWLALASVKWVDWSIVDRLEVDIDGPIPQIGTDLEYRDGWTVTGGVGHQLTEEFTVLGSLTWDRGTSQVRDDGVLAAGTQTDRWGVSLGGAYTLSEAAELSGGVSYSITEDGTNARGESWDQGSVFAISASLKASF
ncbi:outer membrane protein transport protein [Pelagibacterium sp. H642]|uniref:OmpP1/FadL family transporter n=1 Tax=Pelagibacterium sp. H642 TaxID=1881069 RepID=UPI0028168A27|nr:outer membrane protein transport protein [Pelagibacterium sp. H642]WMT90017.1 outer membrane protein transport protein [Pelagibacterium sp. H642]